MRKLLIVLLFIGLACSQTKWTKEENHALTLKYICDSTPNLYVKEIYLPFEIEFVYSGMEQPEKVLSRICRLWYHRTLLDCEITLYSKGYAGFRILQIKASEYYRLK